MVKELLQHLHHTVPRSRNSLHLSHDTRRARSLHENVEEAEEVGCCVKSSHHSKAEPVRGVVEVVPLLHPWPPSSSYLVRPGHKNMLRPMMLRPFP